MLTFGMLALIGFFFALFGGFVVFCERVVAPAAKSPAAANGARAKEARP